MWRSKIAIQFWRVISKNLWESSSLEGICLYIIFESIGSEIQSSCRVCLIPSLALTPSIKHLHLSTWFARVNDTLWITRITIVGFDSVWFSARGVYIVVCELLMRRVSKIVWTDARRTNFFFLEIRNMEIYDLNIVVIFGDLETFYSGRILIREY